jgi:hypothetical protein
VAPDGAADSARIPIDWQSFARPIRPDPTTYGYAWSDDLVRRSTGGGADRVTIPEHFRLDGEGHTAIWSAVRAEDVPASSGLAALRFDRPQEDPQPPYDTPEAAESSFRKPGPVAGPFEARLGDGSVVTYFWYRFADQPALLNADLTPAEREEMQRRVELIHRAWTKDREYLAPPTVGRLARLDPAQIVTPPKGLEVGYVPIATRQELAKDRGPR